VQHETVNLAKRNNLVPVLLSESNSDDKNDLKITLPLLIAG